MDSTGQFVKKLNENQEKAEKNRARAKGSPGTKTQNKQHSTNK